MGTEHEHWLVKGVQVIYTYAQNDICTNPIFKPAFNPGGLSVGFMDSGDFLWKVLETRLLVVVRDNCSSENDTDVDLLLSAAIFRVSCLQLDPLCLPVIHSGLWIVFVVQDVIKAWIMHVSEFRNMPFADAVMQYKLFDGVAKWVFALTNKRWRWFCPIASLQDC